MRIITGSARGTRLKSPVGVGTRPTADRTREALFTMMRRCSISLRGRGHSDLRPSRAERNALCLWTAQRTPLWRKIFAGRRWRTAR